MPDEPAINRLQSPSHNTASPRVANARHPTPDPVPASQCRVRWKCAMHSAGRATLVVLFLFLSPVIVWPQTTLPDSPGVVAQGQQSRQSSGIQPRTSQACDTPASKPETRSKPCTTASAQKPDPKPANPKRDSSAGKQQTSR